MNQDIRAALCGMGFDEAVVFDDPDYDEAIVGVTDEGQAVYDFDRMVEILVERDGMEPLAAIDFIDYNTIRALPYIENPPIVMHRLHIEEEHHGAD